MMDSLTNNLSDSPFEDPKGTDSGVDSNEAPGVDAMDDAEQESDVEAELESEIDQKQGKKLVSGRGAKASGGSTLKSVGGVATSKAITPGAGKKGKAAAADKEAAAKANEAREAAGGIDPFDPAADLPMYREGMDWFVLRVASNKESSVRETLLRKVQIEGMETLVGRIMVPTEKTKTLKGGKQRVTETKLYPGYVFVEMRLEPDGRIPQDVFFLIKETTGVGDFVGTAGRPTPMAPHEVEKMLFDSRRPEETPQVKMEFVKGDSITIKEGPFQNYEGSVDEVLPEKGLVRVLVTIFGRQAPIELEYWQIAKAGT
ncbi:MAG: transcription termination/antitermination protein NusG [Phycisphaerae bacterium]|nr:transcription termination/antitermination protein NusG [Phycisphaerae bacterium]